MITEMIAVTKYRHDLPQRRGGIFLTDGGMETTLIFHEGVELPHFAAFVLLDSPDGRRKIQSQPVAVVGDAVFAGSMGGGLVSYDIQLRNNKQKLMTLPGDTVFACGHGPLTTLKQEKKHNPFFARGS